MCGKGILHCPFLKSFCTIAIMDWERYWNTVSVPSSEDVFLHNILKKWMDFILINKTRKWYDASQNDDTAYHFCHLLSKNCSSRILLITQTSEPSMKEIMFVYFQCMVYTGRWEKDEWSKYVSTKLSVGWEFPSLNVTYKSFLPGYRDYYLL